MPFSHIPIAELRRLVREAEALLRVARNYASQEITDVNEASYATQRIESLVKEANALFPRAAETREPTEADLALQEQLAAMVAAVQSQNTETETESEAETETESEFDWDYSKLAIAIQNDALMSKLPEESRATFKRAAEYLIEANERKELLERVANAFEEVTVATRASMDEAQRLLAISMTFENLASRRN
jgi:hypothetical protein